MAEFEQLVGNAPQEVRIPVIPVRDQRVVEHYHVQAIGNIRSHGHRSSHGLRGVRTRPLSAALLLDGNPQHAGQELFR